MSAHRQPAWPTITPVATATGEAWDSSLLDLRESARRLLTDNPGDLPCVLFEAKESLEIVSLSESITELLGIDITAAVHEAGFLAQRVAPEDRELFAEKLAELETSGSVSFVHRFVQGSGLPIWVSHSLRKVNRHGDIVVRGCLVPISGASRLLALEQEVVSRFIHKLGNQFQLLNLVVASLQSSLPKTRESEVLQDTLDKAIELTRILSECNQVPSWLSEVPLLEVMRAAAESRIDHFAAVGARLQIDFGGIPEDATVLSSPYILEAALGHILQNALDAAGNRNRVEFVGRLEIYGSQTVASLHIKDTGPGIPTGEQDHVLLPFFTTKKGREGLGLTIASRFVEMHGGALRISSVEGKGTEITVLLPVERKRDALCA
jgi:anti-sigma regulatory factor (Ser/Thr protein kinase)